MTVQPPEAPEDDFDAFVERHNIQPDEMGAAFAAWLSGFGWDGNYEQQNPPTDDQPRDTQQEACGPYQ